MVVRAPRLVFVLVALAVTAAAAWAIGLRLVDPLSTRTIPAEDPYTHLALTREHLRDGSFEGLNGPEDTLYPPGLHAVLAVYAVHSGADLPTLVRFLPVAFGAIAVVGVGLLLHRLDGPVAAAVGSLAAAVTPELVFRSQMFAPTALDLALIPFAILALVQTCRGRLAYAVPAALMLAFLVVAHPWVFGILGLAGGAFAILAFVMPWRDAPRLDAAGLAVATLLLGTATALALSGCWGTCGPGFGVVERAAPQRFGTIALLVLGAAAALGAPLLAARRGAQRALDALGPLGPVGRVVAGVALAGGAAYVLVVARRGGYPPLVTLDTMIGWPLMVVAAAGLALVPWARGPGAHAAAGLVAATLPFTVFDPFDSPFWSHRTAAYLALSVAACAGVAAGAAARAMAATSAWAAHGRPARRPWTRALVPGVLVASILGAGLVAASPPQYDGWYRLYDACETEALDRTAALADANPHLVVATGAWQSKLVLAATAHDASRIWFVPGLATQAAEQERLAQFSRDTGQPVLLVLDRHALPPDGNATVPGAGWQPYETSACATPVATHLHPT